jgi:hypothetical protein
MTFRFARLAAIACAAFAASAAYAQGAADLAGDIRVKTIPLQNLSNSDAAKLVSPYLEGHGNSGVFSAGTAVHAVTVRANARLMATVDSLLRANDRPPATVVLRLQIIAASDSALHDASITEIDAELHNLFRFKGYHLLSQDIVRVNESSPFSTIMRGPLGDQLTVSGGIEGGLRDGGKSVQVYITLAHDARTAQMLAGQVQTGTLHQELLHTGLTIPIGQTVVVGSAMTGSSTPAIILTIRPELSTVKQP